MAIGPPEYDGEDANSFYEAQERRQHELRSRTMYTSRLFCRICGNALRPLFTVPAPLVSAFPQAIDPAEPVSVPLDVVQCESCAHVQLLHTVDPKIMYGEYWYESGVNERMQQELLTIVRRAQDFAPLDTGDCVLDIGANDGTLLRHYLRATEVQVPMLHLVAVEPAATFQPRLRAFCEATVHGLFPECRAQIPSNQYKVISSIACFYDMEDPVAAAMAIKDLLHPYGVWVCQFQDLEAQVRLGVWDNFVHEHLSYHTLQTFMEVCNRAGLIVVDCEQSLINGGSLRVFVRHNHVSPVAYAVPLQMQRESTTLQGDWSRRFTDRMRRNIGQIRAFVDPVLDAGGVVDLYGASTKGNTLLQVCGYGPQEIRAAWERNPRKVGRTTVCGVPIIDEELGREDPPDLLLATIWQFKDQIIAREQKTLQECRMLLPLPEATLIEKWGTRERVS